MLNIFLNLRETTGVLILSWLHNAWLFGEHLEMGKLFIKKMQLKYMGWKHGCEVVCQLDKPGASRLRFALMENQCFRWKVKKQARGNVVDGSASQTYIACLAFVEPSHRLSESQQGRSRLPRSWVLLQQKHHSVFFLYALFSASYLVSIQWTFESACDLRHCYVLRTCKLPVF